MKFNLSLLLLLLGTIEQVCIAQSPGAFTPTGHLTTPRQHHTATLLTTGQVLIAGGQMNLPSGDAASSAELYDPVAGTFTAAGNMVSARYGHTATMLPTGQVLIVGGSSGASERALATAELYDAISGRFIQTGSMATGRVFHTATLLTTGKVLITGGYDGKIWAASAELYDPSTGGFTRTGDMTTGRSEHTATLLTNGTVLIEGEDQNGDVSDDVYDPGAGIFAPTGGGTEPAGYGYSSAAALLTSGKVLLTLMFEAAYCDQAKLYDPTAGAFSATANMSLARYYGQTATVLPDGKVLVVGTHDYDQDHATADLYDPGAGTFHITGEADPGREWHTATLLPDGTVLLTGGVHFVQDSSSDIGFRMATLDSAVIYHPAKSTSSPVLFSLTVDASGQGVVWHNATGQLASADNPAVAGEVLATYTTNLIDGAAIPPQVAVGGWLSEILFFGSAPGYPGVSQVNFRMPAETAQGPAVPVRLTYLGRPSNEVTIGVRQ
ncbi:MAG TPA: kelch repeat-containing protein [Bryobacteraceae bacterium]|nr:kelch repeat-containing protein [Bryobacteraceae bacterium]